MKINGQNIFLRTPQLEDTTLHFLWENNSENQKYNETTDKLSYSQIQSFIQNNNNIEGNEQFRLLIVKENNQEPIGTIDLFDISFTNKRAGIGILIFEKEERGKGAGTEALALIEKFASETLHLENLYCNIREDNQKSVQLFEKSGYKKTVIKKKWYYEG